MPEQKTVRIFTMPQQFPCGPQSSCCGPIGQTEEEIKNLKEHLEKNVSGTKVEIHNVMDGAQMKDYRNILTLLRSFGWGILPIIAVNDEPVSMGVPDPQEAIKLIKTKLETGGGGPNPSKGC